MIISAIDIGSNSVRLATFAGGKTLYKRLSTTRLGEGLSASGRLSDAAMERSAEAVASFCTAASNDGAERVYAFATAAVRAAQNGAEFVALVKEKCGVEIDVVDGNTEAKLALLGALRGRDGGVIDVGGASTEITLQSGGKTVFSKSVNVGAVRLLERAGRDRDKLLRIIEEKIAEYGDPQLSGADMYGVSGTPTTLAAIKHRLKIYDPKVVHGTILTLSEVGGYADMLLSMTVDEVKALAGVDENRADIIGGGSLLLYSIMKKFGIEKLTVSESDNLEGYVILKEGRL